MATNVKFARGIEDLYVQDQSTIFFATDTKTIIMNGEKFGGSIDSFEVNEETDELVLKVGGKEHKILLESLLPDELFDLMKGLAGSLVADDNSTVVTGYRPIDSSKQEVGTHVVDAQVEGGFRVIKDDEVGTHVQTTAVYEKNFLEAEGKKLSVRSIDTDCTVLQQDITVAGLNGTFGTGSYQNNDVIPAGTSIYDILVKILSKELFPTSAPTASNSNGVVTSSFSGNLACDFTYGDSIDANKATVEVGTVVSLGSISGLASANPSLTARSYNNFTYGYAIFRKPVAGETAEYALVNGIYKKPTAEGEVAEYVIEKHINTAPPSATITHTGIREGNFSLSKEYSGFNKTASDNPAAQTGVTPTALTYSAESLTVAEGTNTVKFYMRGPGDSASMTASPTYYQLSNFGNIDDQQTKKVDAVDEKTPYDGAHETKSLEKKVTGNYYYYATFIASEDANTSLLTAENIKKSFKKGFISATTTIGDSNTGITFTNGGFHVIACPPGYNLTKVQNAFGSGDLMSNFNAYKTTIGDFPIGGSSTASYTIYCAHSAGDGTVTYKNVIISKG